MLAVLHFLPSRAVLLCGLTWLWTRSVLLLSSYTRNGEQLWLLGHGPMTRMYQSGLKCVLYS